MSSEEATAGSPRSAMDAGQHETAIADSPFGGQSTTTATAFGDQAMVHSLAGQTRAVNNEVYTPALHGVWMRDANTGYVVGAANTVRYTVSLRRSTLSRSELLF